MDITNKSYETVIGLEVHVELSTQSKLFCSCPTSFGQSPNSCICPVCTGMPGALPVLNKAVLEYAVLVGLALNCEISPIVRFDRKNYYYPDSPQNYQISQFYLPVAKNGFLSIPSGSGTRVVRIHELHMEDDAGKLLHTEDGHSLVDYNRSGIPLLEIVTEPDLCSAQEALTFLEKLRNLLLSLRVSDCRMQEGSFRADVNLSLHLTGTPLGTRTEMKNLNSFRAVSHAIEKESERQQLLLLQSKPILQETRRFDDNLGCSYPIRSKEDARDYRYFPEPDLPPLFLDTTFLDSIREKQPELHEQKQTRYQSDYALPAQVASVLCSYRKLSELFEEALTYGADPKKTANRLIVDVLALCRENRCHPDEIKISAKRLCSLLNMSEENRITGPVMKDLLALLFIKDFDPEQYAIENNLLNNSNNCYLNQLVQSVILNNPQSVADYQSGKVKALTFLVGQAMKESKGTADPNKIRTLMEEHLT